MSARDVEAGRAHVVVSLRDKVTGALQQVERSVSGFGRSFATLGTAVSAGAGAALAFPLKLAADMERTSIGFEVLLGSADGAKKMMKDLASFAKNTPFTLDGAAKNAQMLLSYGVAADQIIPNLKSLGDVSLGDEDKFNRLTLAFGQTMAKGRLMGGEVMQMTEAGFNPLQEISRTTGVSVAELSKQMENGQISAAMLAGAFQSATGPGGRFQGGMEKLQKSAYGMMSTLMDAIAFGLRPIGDAALAVLKPLVGFATQVGDAFGAFAERNQWLAKAIAVTLISLFAVGAIIAAVGIGAMALSTIVGGVAIIWGAAIAVLSAVFSPIGVLIGALILAVVTFRSQIASAFSAAASYLAPLINSLAEIWSIFQTTFGGIVSKLMSGDLKAAAGIAWLGFVAAAWRGVADLGGAIAAALEFLQAWIPGVDGVANYVKQAFAGIGQAILAGRWDIAGAIAMAKIRLVITEGWNAISSIWTGFTVLLGGAWDSIVSGIQTTWRSAVTEIAKWLVWIAEQAGFAMDGVKEDLDRMNSADQGRADKAKARRDQARYDAGADAIAKGEAQAQSIRNQIATLEQDAATAYASAGAPTIEDVAQQAKADLAAAIAGANAQVEEAQQSPQVQAMKGLASGGVQQLSKVTSFGTFSAAGAGSLALGFDNSSQQATARNTKRLVTLAEQQRNTGAQFA